LAAGLHEVVKASIVGSILGNILLVLGVSMLVGGARRDRQRFEARAAWNRICRSTSKRTAKM
jgi:Ca2+:H+ antiporter